MLEIYPNKWRLASNLIGSGLSFLGASGVLIFVTIKRGLGIWLQTPKGCYLGALMLGLAIYSYKEFAKYFRFAHLTFHKPAMVLDEKGVTYYSFLSKDYVFFRWDEIKNIGTNKTYCAIQFHDREKMYRKYPKENFKPAHTILKFIEVSECDCTTFKLNEFKVDAQGLLEEMTRMFKAHQA